MQLSLSSGRSDVDALLTYFGISSPESWNSVREAYEVDYRQIRKFTADEWVISAWAREVEILANQLETNALDERLHLSLIELLEDYHR